MENTVWDVTVACGGKHAGYRVNDGENLMEALQSRGALGGFPCGGRGTCGKCRVRIEKGAPAPTAEDVRKISARELSLGWRLACGVSVRGPLRVEVPAHGDAAYSILTAGAENAVTPEPLVFRKFLPSPKELAGASDLSALAAALGQPSLSVRLPLLRALPETLRGARRGLTAVTSDGRLLALEPGDTSGRQFGIAVDIGTTTVACLLIELATGRTVDVEAEVNAQAACGADVIARIAYTSDHARGAETLHSRIVGQLNAMIARLCGRASLSPRDVWQVAVAGNTVMLHFFLGLTAEHIAVSPFTPVTLAAQELTAEELGLCTRGLVYVLPGVASYVGADITAGLLACGADSRARQAEDGCALLLDLGTNGEMALFDGESVTACAVAAGPAFEGGSLSCGVGGVKGAVSHVWLEGEEFRLSTIGDAFPCGICGSGVLDIMALLLQHGAVDETGRMRGESEIENPALRRRIETADGLRFAVAAGASGATAVYFTEKDVREVQLAKAAVAAGIRMLLQKTGKKEDDIKRIFLAGGFGNTLLPASAAAVGLIPPECAARTVAVGNTAGEGARLCLLSHTCRQSAAKIAAAARYVDLSTEPAFQQFFVDAMAFE